ncbi:hypothetical protein [Clavibacter tessellarius]|uniref:hypothetical protein n=1 Tax=Clavibacter tessellarius TaxID=31965 RepID=UPI00324D0AAD
MTAGYVLIVWTTASAWSSLDSDRGGTVLMRSLPHGIRILAAARAASGAFVIGAAGLLLLGVLCAFAPSDPAPSARPRPPARPWPSSHRPSAAGCRSATRTPSGRRWGDRPTRLGAIGHHLPAGCRHGAHDRRGVGTRLDRREATAVALASALLTPLVAAGVTATSPRESESDMLEVDAEIGYAHGAAIQRVRLLVAPGSSCSCAVPTAWASPRC